MQTLRMPLPLLRGSVLNVMPFSLIVIVDSLQPILMIILYTVEYDFITFRSNFSSENTTFILQCSFLL